jgi:hypothetical protein
VFTAIKLTVKFNVAEIVEMSPEWVFARANSAGTTLNHATGATSAEANWSFSFSAKTGAANSKLPATVFPRPTHRASKPKADQSSRVSMGTMKAAVMYTPGGPEVFKIEERLEEAPGGEFRKGDKVASVMGGMGRQFDGSYAEYTCIAVKQVHAVHPELPWEKFGAVPEMLQTTWGSLFRRSIFRRARIC